LRKVPVRIHQDLILNTSMLAEPGDTTLLLPAQTRYEQRGGGTATSTERRIRFTPEIRRVETALRETKVEWEILSLVAQRALPEPARRLLDYANVREIMSEIDRVMPLYRGIQYLSKEGDSLQYGGPILLKDGVCPNLPDGRARFVPVRPVLRELAEETADSFYLTTRRGDQFNSMVYRESDPLTGQRRSAIFFSPVDAEKLGLPNGAPVILRSDHGEFRGFCAIEDVRPGSLQAYWPEANCLLDQVLDPESGEPDYNVFVRVQRVPGGSLRG
jgi:predicted molibdopterin-dependent oxidoreductase YjgC